MKEEIAKRTLSMLYEAFPDKPPYISMNAAAKYLHSRPEKLERDRTFPKRKLGKRYVVPLVALAHWLSC